MPQNESPTTEQDPDAYACAAMQAGRKLFTTHTSYMLLCSTNTIHEWKATERSSNSGSYSAQ
ncbi:hypothetical protein WG66_001496 [Moniliophthora roreri]|nr:hypothetical protein WG66_001496 [Moniliophthora roreri]